MEEHNSVQSSDSQKFISDRNDPIFYTNSALVEASTEECRIEFGIRRTLSTMDMDQTDRVATVYMSLPHMRRLHEAIGTTIDQHVASMSEMIKNSIGYLSIEQREALGLGLKDKEGIPEDG